MMHQIYFEHQGINLQQRPHRPATRQRAASFRRGFNSIGIPRAACLLHRAVPIFTSSSPTSSSRITTSTCTTTRLHESTNQDLCRASTRSDIDMHHYMPDRCGRRCSSIDFSNSKVSTPSLPGGTPPIDIPRHACRFIINTSSPRSTSVCSSSTSSSTHRRRRYNYNVHKDGHASSQYYCKTPRPRRRH